MPNDLKVFFMWICVSGWVFSWSVNKHKRGKAGHGQDNNNFLSNVARPIDQNFSAFINVYISRSHLPWMPYV